jgi:hypothetical protein
MQQIYSFPESFSLGSLEVTKTQPLIKIIIINLVKFFLKILFTIVKNASSIQGKIKM